MSDSPALDAPVGRSRTLGSRAAWARDFALVGGASSLFIPYTVVGDHFGFGYLLATAGAGVFFGALLGAAVPTFLSGKMRRMPFWLLLLLGPAIGALWGASVGATGGLMLQGGWVQTSIVLAAGAAALQFSWLWLPYLVLRHRGGATWPLVTVACIAPTALIAGLLIF